MKQIGNIYDYKYLVNTIEINRKKLKSIGTEIEDFRKWKKNRTKKGKLPNFPIFL